jgi:hypothetical protein
MPADAPAPILAAFDRLRHGDVVRQLVAACGPTPCHLVGGILRDAALGLATHDLDVVVAGGGRQIAETLAASLPARFVPLGGKEFAAFRLVMAPAAPMPPTTPRVQSTPSATSEPPLVIDIWDREASSLHDDLARRDLTINSIAVEALTGVVIDPFGGLADLQRRLLRATTADSFAGDPLRVLRLARLDQQLPGFTVEPSTLGLARASSPALATVAAERIRDELWRILAHPDAARGLRRIADLRLYPDLWLGLLLPPPGATPRPAAPDHAPASRVLGAAAASATGAIAAADGTEGLDSIDSIDALDTIGAIDAVAASVFDTSSDAVAVEQAAAEIEALAGCAEALEGWLADQPATTAASIPAAAPSPPTPPRLPSPPQPLISPGSPSSPEPLFAPGASTARWDDPLDLPTARFAATLRYLPPGSSRPAPNPAASNKTATAPTPAAAEGRPASTPALGAAPPAHLAGLVRMQEAGIVSARQAALIATLLATPPVLPDDELGRRRFLHHHGRRWATVACSFGAAASASGPAARDRWNAAAAALCSLARSAGASLAAPPRLLDGDDVRRLLGVPPGPAVGRALAALSEAQVDGLVGTREQAERFILGER